jgi:hypothetical protein
MSAYAAFAAFAAAAFAAFAAAATVAAAFAAAAAAAAAVVLGVFALLRARCAGEDVAAGIVILWARLVAKGSPVDELLVGDPHRVGRRDVEKPVPGRRVVDCGDAQQDDSHRIVRASNCSFAAQLCFFL